MADNRLISENADGITVTYTYDDLGRLTQKQTKNGDTVIKTDSYTFTATADGTSTQVASYNGLSYTYDDNGNILSVSDGTNTTSYFYDSANQLVRENNQALGFTKVWTYDNAGNILSRTEYAYTTADDLSSLTATDAVTYQYTSAKWGDMLRVYDGQNLTYDGSGNLTNDGKFTYTWAHGRELVCVTAPSGAQVLATYGADGLRTGRVVMYSSGTVRAAYTYVYNGSKLSKMTYGNYVVDITYDAAGTPLTMVINGQTTYHYVTNLQGDVIALTDETGAEVITYSYDAWGKVVSHTGTYATLNPLLYRGYVYDWETHHYYLQSRYYNPEWGRFINADGLVTTGQGFVGNNMFAYCLNNPIILCDPIGYAPSCIVTICNFDSRNSGNTIYASEEDAAFAAGVAARIFTNNSDVEYACGIYKIDGVGYIIGNFVKGEHDSVSVRSISPKYNNMQHSKLYAIVHSHPYCNGHNSNEFSITQPDNVVDTDFEVALQRKIPIYLAAPNGNLDKMETYTFYLGITWEGRYITMYISDVFTVSSGLPMDTTIYNCLGGNP